MAIIGAAVSVGAIIAATCIAADGAAITRQSKSTGRGNGAICSSQPGPSIPDSFPIEACYDGLNVVLRNNTDLPLRANTTPYVAPPSLNSVAPIMPIASKLALDVEGFLSLHPDPYLLMPGTQLTIPTGKTGNKVKIEMWASGDVYVVADAITKLIPLAGIPDGEAKFVNDAVDIFRTWKACSSGANTLQKIGCAATAAWEIKTDFERDAAAIAIDFVGGEAKIVKEIYDSFTDIREGTLLNADLGKFNAGAKEIDIAPASSTGSSGTLPSPQVPPGGSASGSSPTVPATGPTPTKPQTTASPRLPVFTVMNTSETPPDGVWFRNSPHTADTSRITGLGVYAGENVRLECFAWGDAVGPYNDRLWYLVADISRATVSGRANSGYLNAHYINDGMVANQVDSGVPQC